MIRARYFNNQTSKSVRLYSRTPANYRPNSVGIYFFVFCYVFVFLLCCLFCMCQKCVSIVHGRVARLRRSSSLALALVAPRPRAAKFKVQLQDPSRVTGVTRHRQLRPVPSEYIENAHNTS